MPSAPARNRRCKKLINKKYRKYGDIWGRLAIKKRHNFITTLVYKYERSTFHQRLKAASKKKKRRIYRYVIPRSKKSRTYKRNHKKTPKKRRFAFEIISKEKRLYRKRHSRRGNLLKLRRQISLYYGGGRIRKKTFRRYGYMSHEHTNPQNYLHNKRHRTYGSILESRLDVLLLRSNFVDSIYKSRMLIMHHKSFVQGHDKIDHPGILVENFQRFGIRGHYTKVLRNIFYIKNQKHGIIHFPPHLYINFPMLIAFKLEDPITHRITFPFSEQAGSLAVFRKAYTLL